MRFCFQPLNKDAKMQLQLCLTCNILQTAWEVKSPSPKHTHYRRPGVFALGLSGLTVAREFWRHLLADFGTSTCVVVKGLFKPSFGSLGATEDRAWESRLKSRI